MNQVLHRLASWSSRRAPTGILSSRAEFVQASVYDLADALGEIFDLVIFWGVPYHLRHRLLGLDSVRRPSRGRVPPSVETLEAWVGSAGFTVLKTNPVPG